MAVTRFHKQQALGVIWIDILIKTIINEGVPTNLVKTVLSAIDELLI